MEQARWFGASWETDKTLADVRSSARAMAAADASRDARFQTFVAEAAIGYEDILAPCAAAI